MENRKQTWKNVALSTYEQRLFSVLKSLVMDYSTMGKSVILTSSF